MRRDAEDSEAVCRYALSALRVLCAPPPRPLRLPDCLLDEARDIAGADGDADARRFEGGHLLRRRARAPGDDRARVAHPLAGRGGLAGDEADDGLGHVLL